MGALNELRDKAHATAREKGWYEHLAPGQKRNVGEALALIHCEVSEWMEEERMGHAGWWRDESGKPVGPDIEAADILIRLFDLAGHLGIDLDEAVRVKMEYNKTRPHKHGRLL